MSRGRRGRAWLAGLLLALCAVAVAVPAGAQERRSFLERLFTPLHKHAEPPAPPAQIRRRKPAPPARNRAKRRSAPAAAAPAPQKARPAVEKLDNARIVLVIGDFTANGLAEGLTEAFDNAPGVRVVARASGSSGLVRDDYYDWVAELPALLDEVKPHIVTVMLGANDRQEYRSGAHASASVLSEEWKREYERRAGAIATTIATRRLPFFWVGQPSYGSQRMSSGMIALNDIYNRTATAVGGIFVDIWDGFVDENGAFIATGPDMNGQPARLRASDGINLTHAGRRKIAFYAEKPLRKLLGDAADPKIAALDPASAPILELGPTTPQHIDRTPPIRLDDPGADGEVLLGAEFSIGNEADESEVAERPAQPPPGRADNFRPR